MRTEPALYDEPTPDRLIRPVLLALVATGLVLVALVQFSVVQIDAAARQTSIGHAKALIAAYAQNGDTQIDERLRDAGFAGARYVVSGGGGVHKDEAVVPITGPHGLRIGTIAFVPDTPARTVFTATAPYKLALVGTGLLLAVFFSIRMRRVTRRIERKRSEAQKLALTDPLSGLGNRRRFFGFVSERLAQPGHAGEDLALYFIDLDGFKRVNDTYGHAAGDRLIKTVADRLLTHAGPHDLVARLSGDEFAFVRMEKDGQDGAAHFADDLVECFSIPFALSEHRVGIGASIGYVLASQLPDPDFSEFCRAADVALYAAKNGGRRQAVRFSQDQSAAFVAGRYDPYPEHPLPSRGAA